jgi:hypothetical protein
MSFKIGQKIICVENHCMNLVKRGQIFIIKDIRVCSCGNVSLSLHGYADSYMGTTCFKCKTIYLGRYFRSTLFRPLIYDGNAIVEILEKFAPIEERSDIEIKEPIAS